MIPFIKMHGAGNDFVIINALKTEYPSLAQHVPSIAARHFGIGCDQVIVMEPSEKADCFMRIYNADGSESGSCGNATRCVAELLMEANHTHQVSIETLATVLEAFREENGPITVDMGKPELGWREVPLAKEVNTVHLEIGEDELQDPVALSMGNPHAVFFVDDVDNTNVDHYGPIFESHDMFPERANIGFCQVVSDNHLKLRVFERGSGETLACGSGACAAVVAASRRQLIDKKATVSLPGGDLEITWLKNGHVLMAGPVVKVYEGEIAAELLECPRK